MNLICTGRPYKPFHPTLVEAVKRHGLGDQVQFLGISEELLAVCYKRSKFIVFPSLLEGHSQSLLDRSTTTSRSLGAQQSSVPETVGSAGYLFDALDVDAMAEAIGRAWTDEALLAHSNTEGSFERYRWDRALVRSLPATSTRPAALTPEEKSALDRALLEHKPEDA